MRRDYYDDDDDENLNPYAAVRQPVVLPDKLGRGDMMLAALLGAGTLVFALALALPGLYPSAWGDLAIAAGLRPAEAVFPGLWRLIGRAVYFCAGVSAGNIVMWALGKMGETALSPDGTQLVYANTYYSMEENKGNAELYLLPTQNEGAAVRLTVTPQNENNPVWKDDSTLLFARGNEIVSMNIASKAEKVLATVEDGFMMSAQDTR